MVRLSVIVPVRNEVKFIDRCIESLINQDFPRSDYEIIVIDGMSTDGTREILRRFQERGLIRLLDNPMGLTPYALNIGIRNAKAAEFIARVDGHAYVAHDYLKEGVKFLESHPEVDVVGGPLQCSYSSKRGTAIAEAMKSLFGTGGVAFRRGGVEGPVDTVAFGIYRTKVFEKVGLFREDLPKNQDDELHLRIRKRGGVIYLTNKIRVYYNPRENFRDLFHQYYGYGFFKPKVMKLHKKVDMIRHMVPPLFVLWLSLLILLAAFSEFGRYLLLFTIGLYLGLGLTFALLSSRGKTNPIYLLFAFLSMHFGYGLGFLRGLYSSELKLHRAKFGHLGGRSGL